MVDAERGLIVISRNIVPFAMGDLSITIADSIIVPGKVVYLHPTHNFAIIPTLPFVTPQKKPTYNPQKTL